MTLVRWRPVRNLPAFPSDILGMQKEINRMFEEFFRGEEDDLGLPSSSWRPAVDIVEKDGEYLAKVEIPGVNKDDVKVSLMENVLTIRGEKTQEKKEESTNYHHIERFSGSFQRSFELPGRVKTDKIDAEYKDGILTIRLPKAEESKTRQIEVKVH
ncbi:MAG: Hsp20/alpha crystallin family protein [Bacteroidota bacterium]